jgi:hypothetical protein
MANGVAPVCPVVRSQVLPEPKRQLIPSIRRATSGTDTTNTINQIIHTLDIITNNSDQPEWVEITRNTQRVRIHSAVNYANWVEVERITRLVFQDKITGAKLEWKYRPT